MIHSSSMDSPGPSETSPTFSSYELLFQALSLIPASLYLSGLLFTALVFFYNFLEIHFLHDLLTAFRGDRVSLIYNSSSELYQSVASKCRILHGRYLATPWLSSPHLQTVFLSLFGKSPSFRYKRQLFRTSDGGTIALDWLRNSDVKRDVFQPGHSATEDDKTPIVVVIPGLTSDSDSSYIKHLAFKMVQRGWNVVVSNHRGLGGISLTSDCFYNGGWTEDIRRVVAHLHSQYPEAPLFLVGTSIGANILVKYLGEDGSDTPIVGAAAICSPWDLLVCDRFINRRFVQKLYNRALTVGLQGYATLHQSILIRLANWEGIEKSRSLRDFDHHATRVLGNFETVDTYYRRCSSAGFVGNVAVPLLCISALDDPLCSKEAIPWDECRENKNIILVTTTHGGHLAFYEGLTASSLWWVRAVDEFLGMLHSCPLVNLTKQVHKSASPIPLKSAIDQAPYVNILEDGMVTAMGNEQTTNAESIEEVAADIQTRIVVSDPSKTYNFTERAHSKDEFPQFSEQNGGAEASPIRGYLKQLSRHGQKSIWLLAYIAIVTTWPLVGPAVVLFLKKKFRNSLPAALLRR